MTGRHHLAQRLRARRPRLVLAGAVLVALVLAGVTAARWPAGDPPAPTGAVTPHTAAPEAVEPEALTPDTARPAPTWPDSRPDPDRGAERPSRGGGHRAAAPEASPAPDEPTTEPAPTTGSRPEPSAPGTVPDSGGVVTTGTCEASYYWEPQPTASGEVFDPEALTAAHKTWDFGTRVRVTNPANRESVVVRINDRGPYIDGRCLDLARGAFREIATLEQGVVTVTYEVLSD